MVGARLPPSIGPWEEVYVVSRATGAVQRRLEGHCTYLLADVVTGMAAGGGGLESGWRRRSHFGVRVAWRTSHGVTATPVAARVEDGDEDDESTGQPEEKNAARHRVVSASELRPVPVAASLLYGDPASIAVTGPAAIDARGPVRTRRASHALLVRSRELTFALACIPSAGCDQCQLQDRLGDRQPPPRLAD